MKLNKELQDLVAIRRKTVNLINDAPANILRLKVRRRFVVEKIKNKNFKIIFVYLTQG